MKIITKDHKITKSSQLLDSIFTSGSVFFDIETTGLSPDKSFVYLIGMAIRTPSGFKSIQLFAETPDNEPELLKYFCEYIENKETLISFNGYRFDMPFIKKRCKNYNITVPVINHLDILKQLKTVPKILSVENYKQKTLESFLSIIRDDIYNGKELINVYYDYIKSSDGSLFDCLILHNLEDVCNMTLLVDILAYTYIFYDTFDYSSLLSYKINEYKDIDGKLSTELILTFNLKYDLPIPISKLSNEIYFKASSNILSLSIKMQQNQLKHFIKDYKNYYYFPDEDTAMHKSVAVYADKSHRQKCNVRNCYIKKDSLFLFDPGKLYEPVFRCNYESKEYYMDFNDSKDKLKDTLSEYIHSILKYQFNQK